MRLLVAFKLLMQNKIIKKNSVGSDLTSIAHTHTNQKKNADRTLIKTSEQAHCNPTPSTLTTACILINLKKIIFVICWQVVGGASMQQHHHFLNIAIFGVCCKVTSRFCVCYPDIVASHEHERTCF